MGKSASWFRSVISMQAVLIYSSTSKQLILTSRISSAYAALPSLCLDALTSNTIPRTALLWLPGYFPAQQHKSRTSQSAHRNSYDAEEDEDSEESDSETEAALVENNWTDQPSSSKNGVASTSNLQNKRSEGACCCVVSKNGLKFAVPVISDVDPVLPFAFLESLISVLEDYFGQLSEAVIKDSFDVVLQILEEALCSPHPGLTDASALKEFILPPSIMSKVLSAASNALSPGVSKTGPVTAIENRSQTLSSPIPWRRSAIKYQSQEVFFDVVEEISGIIDKYGKLVAAQIWGSIESKCRLSEMPDLLMSLSSPDLLEDACFHPCVRLARWNANKTLSFVPPDGSFTLMQYRLAEPTTSTFIPVHLKPIITTGSNGGAFQLTLSSRNPASRPLENVKLLLRLGTTATSVQATISGGHSLSHTSSTSRDELPGGRWEFDPQTGWMGWLVPKLSSSEKPCVLEGTWVSSVSPCPSPALGIQASFECALSNVSGIQISSLKVASQGGAEGLYKGVRPMTKSGKLEFRW